MRSSSDTSMMFITPTPRTERERADGQQHLQAMVRPSMMGEIPRGRHLDGPGRWARTAGAGDGGST
jgi:hypothetical protein